MCLINFQLHTHPHYKLIVAANRDESYDRPTASAHFWKDHPQLLAGRDLLQLGTWLGITKHGRFAALTNFRDPAHMEPGKISRGSIVKNFLTGVVSPQNFMQSLQETKDNYTGFNLIAGDPDQLLHYNNVHDEITEIAAGTHGLSNDTLNTPWPKVIKGKRLLKSYLAQTNEIKTDALFKFLSNSEEASTLEDLPHTGLGEELERKLSPLFIKTDAYGTRCSTALLIDKRNHVTFAERSYRHGEFLDEKHFSFQINNR